MAYPELDAYLARLPGADRRDAKVWRDAGGRVQGRYFQCTLTSVFQPIRAFGENSIVAFEAYARSYSDSDDGLSLWRLLEQAASDDESVQLDRLCRMLHAANFFRQAQAAAADLYLSVHDRLLAAVTGNHGCVFRRILEGLGLPVEAVVLQLPAAQNNSPALLNFVADNYRMSGFRLALNVANARQALPMLERLRPHAVKVDAREITDIGAVRELLVHAFSYGTRVVFKRLESTAALQRLEELLRTIDLPLYAQGYRLDMPQPALDSFYRAEMANGADFHRGAAFGMTI